MQPVLFKAASFLHREVLRVAVSGERLHRDPTLAFRSPEHFERAHALWVRRSDPRSTRHERRTPDFTVRLLKEGGRYFTPEAARMTLACAAEKVEDSLGSVSPDPFHFVCELLRRAQDEETLIRLFENLMRSLEVRLCPRHKRDENPSYLDALGMLLVKLHAGMRADEYNELCLKMATLKAQTSAATVRFRLKSCPHPALLRLYEMAPQNPRAHAVIAAMMLFLEDASVWLYPMGCLNGWTTMPGILVWPLPDRLIESYNGFARQYNAQWGQAGQVETLRTIFEAKRNTVVDHCRQMWGEIIHDPRASIRDCGQDTIEVAAGPIAHRWGAQRTFIREGYEEPCYGVRTERPGITEPRYWLETISPSVFEQCVRNDEAFRQQNGVGGLQVLDHYCTLLGLWRIICYRPGRRESYPGVGVSARQGRSGETFEIRSHWRELPEGQSPDRSKVLQGMEERPRETVPPNWTFVKTCNHPYPFREGACSSIRSNGKPATVLRVSPERVLNGL